MQIRYIADTIKQVRIHDLGGYRTHFSGDKWPRPGREGGGGGGVGSGEGTLSVPWVPNPKLIPERDGSGGMSWDVHLRSEVSDACRNLSVLSKALGRRGGVYIYRHVGAELLQLERVVSGYVAVRGLRACLAWAGRLEIPGRGGIREGYGDALALPAELAGIVQRPASRHLHGDLPGVALGYSLSALCAVRGRRGYGAARA